MCLIKKQKNGYLGLCQLLIKKKSWAQGHLNLLHTKSQQKQATLKEPQGSGTGTAPYMRGGHQAGDCEDRMVPTWLVHTASCSLQN